MILGRRTKLPRDVAAHVTVQVLASAELADGRWAVVSPGALVVADAEGVRGRHPWHEIQHGSWDGEVRRLTITWVDGTREPLVLATASEDFERFTTALRERVQSSVVHTETAETASGALVRAQVRRDEDGDLFSQLTVQGRLDGDAEERRLIDALERRVRAAVGLPT